MLGLWTCLPQDSQLSFQIVSWRVSSGQKDNLHFLKFKTHTHSQFGSQLDICLDLTSLPIAGQEFKKCARFSWLWTCFFLYPTCILAWPLLLVIHWMGSGNGLESLMWFQTLPAFSALKPTAQRHLKVFDVYHTAPNTLGMQQRRYRGLERKWNRCCLLLLLPLSFFSFYFSFSLSLFPSLFLSLIKKDGVPSTLPINSLTLFCLIFTKTIWNGYDSIFAIFTGVKTEE